MAAGTRNQVCPSELGRWRCEARPSPWRRLGCRGRGTTLLSGPLSSGREPGGPPSRTGRPSSRCAAASHAAPFCAGRRPAPGGDLRLGAGRPAGRVEPGGIAAPGRDLRRGRPDHPSCPDTWHRAQPGRTSATSLMPRRPRLRPADPDAPARRDARAGGPRLPGRRVRQRARRPERRRYRLPGARSG